MKDNLRERERERERGKNFEMFLTQFIVSFECLHPFRFPNLFVHSSLKEKFSLSLLSLTLSLTLFLFTLGFFGGNDDKRNVSE